MGFRTQLCPPHFSATRRKSSGKQQPNLRHHVRVYSAAWRPRSYGGGTMKNKSILIMIGLALYCACAVAQQTAPAASAPYAGATISDFKGKVSIQLPAQA